MPLMELLIYDHIVKYQHCDYLYFIQFTLHFFLHDQCLVNKLLSYYLPVKRSFICIFYYIFTSFKIYLWYIIL